jgi:hypothetical protein
LRGLRQTIDSEEAYVLALTWVRVCIIIHCLAFEAEHILEDEDFWEWVQQGTQDDHFEQHEAVRDPFFAPDEVHIGRETDGQLKRRQVQRALFDSL